MRLPRAWFLPETHDVLSTLTAQLDIVQTVIGVLRAWCARTGEEDIIGQLRSLLATEHETRRGCTSRFGPVSVPPSPGGPF